MRKKFRPEVVIFVSGGNVQDVLSNDPELIPVIVIDRDNEEGGDIQEEIPEWCKKIIGENNE